MKDVNAIAATLRRAGFRATKQRISLVRRLSYARRPMSVAAIARELADTDLVTVYRVLHSMQAAGIVREINLRGHTPAYELSDEQDHHHIVCTYCGRIEDFTDETHERIAKRVLAGSKSFKAITGHSFDLYGVCKPCAK